MEKQMFTNLERLRNRNFVSPILCQEIAIRGIGSPTSLYTWLILDEGVMIRTNRKANGELTHEAGINFGKDINGASSCQAFTACEMDMLLPPYCITKNAFGEYEVMLDDTAYVQQSFKSDRLPDALAKAFISLLKEHKIDKSAISEQLKNIQ